MACIAGALSRSEYLDGLAAVGQLVDQVERVEDRAQPRPVSRRSGLLVDVNPLPSDAGRGQCLDLPVKILFAVETRA